MWFGFRACGVERVPSRGGALLLINHQSFLDPIFVGLPLARPVSYLARDSLFGVPVVGWILKRTYVIPINREAASSTSIRLAAERLQQGFLVGLFPEGTRSRDGEIGPLKPGFMALLRRVDVPVIPVAVAGSGAAFPRDAWFPRPRRCGVLFGEPIPRETFAVLADRGRQEFLIDEIRARMVDCSRQAEAWLARRQ